MTSTTRVAALLGLALVAPLAAVRRDYRGPRAATQSTAARSHSCAEQSGSGSSSGSGARRVSRPRAVRLA